MGNRGPDGLLAGNLTDDLRRIICVKSLAFISLGLSDSDGPAGATFCELHLGTVVGHITGPGYFSPAIQKVRSLQTSEGSWQHLAQRVVKFEQQWLDKQT